MHIDDEKWKDGIISRINFPLKKSHNTSQLEVLTEYELIDGGRFIADCRSTSNEDLADTLQLLSSFIYILPGYCHTKFKCSMFNVLPKMLVDFANGSRFDSGYRLLNRCLTHIFDNKSETLLNKKAILIKTEKK